MKDRPILTLRVPLSTYRLQFSRNFTFSHAKELIPYLFDLGITDIYASPYFVAKEGSTHGYDIVDLSGFNPEIGNEDDYILFSDELKKRNMGQLLDIVPNHMCIASKDNAWWMDILENGKSSRYSVFFDIDWEPVEDELRNKVLLPFLGKQYGTALEDQELRLFFEKGSFFMEYFNQRFPVRPQTYILILGHRIDELERRMEKESPVFTELLSIITSLKNLPSYLETSPENTIELRREKEVAKKRLSALYNSDSEIKRFIDENIETFNGVKGDPASFDLLDRLMNEQVYRLSYWPVATEEINYRRFFDINDLAAIRVEDPLVFEETHRFLFRLIREGRVTGLRIDHSDGLYNPLEYFQRLQYNCFRNIMLDHLEKTRETVPLSHDDSYIDSEIRDRFNDIPDRSPFYIVGEKILIKSERMPEEWPIFSTTGYVFLNSLNGIFVETQNAKVFENIYANFIKTKPDYQEQIYQNKKLIMESAVASEINTLGHNLKKFTEKNRHTRDFTLHSLVRAIVEVIAFFPVYRTYINDMSVTERDKQYIEHAIVRAKRKNPAFNASIFDFLYDVLLLRYSATMSDDEKKECLDFVMKFQQLTGPVMAKAVEDTTFYVFNRLISLNDVGGSPDKFGTTLETFHGQNIERRKFWSHALIATSTHDTKRGEDVRARINVLSEMPRQWRERIKFWSVCNKVKKIKVDGQLVPSLNEEYHLYQTLIGSWPIGPPMDGDSRDVYIHRVKEYMLKAIREAKVNSSWINPNYFYEESVMAFIDSLLAGDGNNQFLNDFVPFQRTVSCYGMYNSLSQVLLKITAPGVPDFYQGNELWNYTLVDPDNRSPVDFKKRINILDEIREEELSLGSRELVERLAAQKEDGKIKMYITYKALLFRKQFSEIFENGNYIPLDTLGQAEGNICAFARKSGDSIAIIAVPRFFTRLTKEPERYPFPEENWGDSLVVDPFSSKKAAYMNIFTGEVMPAGKQNETAGFYGKDLFRSCPVALLHRINRVETL